MFVVSAQQKTRKLIPNDFIISFSNDFCLLSHLLLSHFAYITFCLYHNLSDNVEKNPGPKSYSAQYLAICHWNQDTETVDCKIGVARNFAKYTGKHLCESLFFNKVVGLSLQLC